MSDHLAITTPLLDNKNHHTDIVQNHAQINTEVDLIQIQTETLPIDPLLLPLNILIKTPTFNLPQTQNLKLLCINKLKSNCSLHLFSTKEDTYSKANAVTASPWIVNLHILKSFEVNLLSKSERLFSLDSATSISFLNITTKQSYPTTLPFLITPELSLILSQ